MEKSTITRNFGLPILQYFAEDLDSWAKALDTTVKKMAFNCGIVAVGIIAASAAAYYAYQHSS